MSDLDEFLEESEVERDSPEVEVLKRRVARLERKLRRDAGLSALVMDAVHEALADYPGVEVPQQPKRSRKKLATTGYLLISDTHVGALTPDYSVAKAEARIMQVAEKAVKITEARRTSQKLDEIVVGLNGDLLDGSILRHSHAQHVEVNVMEQALSEGPRIFARMLSYLAGAYPKVRVVLTGGNHERNGRFGSMEASNGICWAVVLGETTKHLLKPLIDDGRVEFLVSREWCETIQVGGTRILQTHGDVIRGSSSSSHMGLPIAGLAARVSRWGGTMGAEMVCMGHYHTPLFVSRVANRPAFVVNGSTESGGEYGSKLGLDGDPSQTFMVFRNDGELGSAGLLAYHVLYVD